MSSVSNELMFGSGKPRNAKGAIVHQLAQRFPQTTKQLAHALPKEYGMNVTYQAVHKALQELERDCILSRNKNEWMLNQEWLLNQERFIHQTKEKYGGNKNKYNINLNYDGPQIFEFNNFTDFCVETASLVADKVLCQNKEAAYWVLEYGWWTPKFKFAHLKLLSRLMQSSPKSIHVIRKITPFGIWMQKQYERVGGKGIIGKNVPFKEDMLVQGEWILQVRISPEGKKIIQKYWNKWKNLEDCFKEFGLKEEPKMKIVATLNRNPGMAKFLSNEVEKYCKNQI